MAAVTSLFSELRKKSEGCKVNAETRVPKLGSVSGVFFCFFFSQLVRDNVFSSILFLLRESDIWRESLLMKRLFLAAERGVRRQEAVAALTY